MSEAKAAKKNPKKKQKQNGLFKRGETWHIDRYINGQRVCQSTETKDRKTAERILAKLVSDSFNVKQFGERPKRTFQEAAIEYLNRNGHKRSIDTDVSRLGVLENHSELFGIYIDEINNDSLREFIANRKVEGKANGTINHGIALVKLILKQATRWTDEHNLTWLDRTPDIDLLPNRAENKRQPYPLNWSEQERLFAELPEHLRRMALFAVNTGCRDAEICNLRWEWEHRIEQLNVSIFVVPPEIVKNGIEHLVVLNSIAMDIVEQCRGNNPTHVFSYRGEPIKRMLNSAWMRARLKADLPMVRVHDLKHTFGSRLKNEGVNHEVRQELLGHKTGSITEHYSRSGFQLLLEAAEKVCPRPNEPLEDMIVWRRGSMAS